MALPRMRRISTSLRPSRSRPSNRIEPSTMRPGGDGTKRSTESAVTLLPQPDSPTTARVSPAPTSKETPSTARTTPSRVKKCVRRSSMARSGAFNGRVSHAARKPGIERIAQAVADQVHRQHGQRQEDAGEDDEIGLDLKIAATFRHDVAPARN